MYESHSIPVSVELQHKHTSFYLMKHWLGARGKKKLRDHFFFQLVPQK